MAGVVVVVGALAVVLVRTSGAQTFRVVAEAESGTPGGAHGLTLLQTAAASGGRAVQFAVGPPPPPPPPPTPPPPSGACSVSGSQSLQDQAESNPPRNVWPHTKPNEAVVYYITSGLPSEWVTYVTDGAKAWSVSNCIDARTATSCPSKANCVPVRIDTTTTGNGPLGTTSSSYSDGVLKDVSIVIYANRLSSALRAGTTAHEMGHALGLKHRATALRLLYSTNVEQRSKVPDNIDFTNLLALYGAATVKSAAVGLPTVTETIE